MDYKEEIREALLRKAHQYLARGTKKFSWRSFMPSLPGIDSMIGKMDPIPIEGKVRDKCEVAPGEYFLVVAEGRNTLAVIHEKCLPAAFWAQVRDGDTVTIEPYARRRFSGERCDAPKRDGVFLTYRLGDADPEFPHTDELQCPALIDLIGQLRTMPAPDGFRRAAHVLIDAGARSVRYVDPAPAMIIATPPAVSCTVATRKHRGEVTIVYDRGFDYYRIDLRDGAGSVVASRREVDFTSLAEVLVDLIDDGAWQTARAEITKRAASLRRPTHLPAEAGSLALRVAPE